MQYTEISSNNLKMKFNVLCKTVSLSLNVLKQRKKNGHKLKKGNLNIRRDGKSHKGKMKDVFSLRFLDSVVFLIELT